MSGIRRTERRPKRRTALRQVLFVLALALGVLPLLPGVAHAHHAEITASIDCDSVVQFTATAWVGTGGADHEASRTHDHVRVWYTVDGGAPQVVVGNGQFNAGNNFQFSGQFQTPATGTISVYTEAIGNWANGAAGGGPQTTGALTRPTNCGPPDSTDVSICHATGSSSNPYVLIEHLSAAGVYNGHLGSSHQNGEDIIPPFVYQGQTYSQNWDSAHQAIFRSGCEPPAEPNLTFSKSGPATVAQGGTVTYTISVENTGGAPADDVRILDQVDANLTNISASASQGSCAIQGNLVRCDLGTLAAGASATVTITATAPTGSCPTLSNKAQIKSGLTTLGTTNTVTTEVTGCEPPAEPNLTFSKSGPATVAQGGTVTYTISVENTGGAPADDVRILDQVDANLTNISASASQGSCAIQGNLVRCDLGTLAAGASATVTITATAPTGSCPTLSNKAQIKSGLTTLGTTNTVTTEVTGCEPGTPGVSVTKSASAVTVQAGGSFTYTVAVSNTGSATAENVVVTDTIPSGLTINSVSGPGCSFTGQNVTCNVGDIAAGGSVTITISVTATTRACPSVTNTAHVSFNGETGSGSADSNAVTVNVTCAPSTTPGVSVTKSASAVTVQAGGSFTYTIVVSSTGSAAAQNVVVTDTIPSGLTINSVSGPGCSFTGQNVTCNVGDIAAGGSVTITISVTATAGACPSVVNRAHVSFSGGTGSGSADSNAVTVGVNCEPDVQIVKNSDAPGRGIESGDSFTYTITVSNDGNATAEGVVVTDTIPAGLTIDDVTGPNCSLNGQVVTCNVGDLAAGASVSITIDVTADDDACPAVENFAHVEWDDGEETDSEDSNTVVVDVDCVGGETVTPTPPPDDEEPGTVTPPGGTAFTGPDEGTARLGLLSIALLVFGSGLMFAGYRRRARQES